MERIGLIAGNRKFPLLFAEAARKKGYEIVALAIKNDTSPELRRFVNKLYWVGLNEFSRSFEILQSEKVTKVVMAGQISPERLFSKEVSEDKELSALLKGLHDKRADTIFRAIAARFKERGFEVLDSTLFMGEYLPKKGALTVRKPDFTEWEDIYFGLNLAKAIAYLDIGQTVAVKAKAVVGVEAMEGTDNLIRRAGKVTRGGFSVIKVSKPRQDLRFDIPVVGLKTIRTMARYRARCLAIEAEKTLFIDRELSIDLANRKGIAIVSI